MIGDYGKMGWDDLPSDDELSAEGGGGGKFTDEQKLYRFRFKMESAKKNPIEPGKPVRHRVLFLNGSPFSFWEHGLFPYRGCGHWNALCLAKNKIERERGCPICDDKKQEKKNWAYFIGMFSIIDFGQVVYKGSEFELHHRNWTNKDGETFVDSFPRLLLGAKMGSQESPGVLKKLLWQAERKGNSLEGTIWDTSRSGEKEAGVGESWEYIDRIAPEDYVSYLQKHGADIDKLNVDPVTNWREICKPLSYEACLRITGGSSSGSQGSSRAEGAGYAGDDEIPF